MFHVVAAMENSSLGQIPEDANERNSLSNCLNLSIFMCTEFDCVYICYYELQNCLFLFQIAQDPNLKMLEKMNHAKVALIKKFVLPHPKDQIQVWVLPLYTNYTVPIFFLVHHKNIILFISRSKITELSMLSELSFNFVKE